MINRDLEQILKDVENWMEKKRSPFQYFGIKAPVLDRDPICSDPLFGFMLALKMHEKPTRYKVFKKLWNTHFAEDMHAQTLDNISALAFEGIKRGVRLSVIKGCNKEDILYSMYPILKFWTLGGGEFGGNSGVMRRSYVFMSDTDGRMNAQYFYSNISLDSMYGNNRSVTFMDKDIPASRTIKDAIISLISEYQHIDQVFDFIMSEPMYELFVKLLYNYSTDENKNLDVIRPKTFNNFVSNLSRVQQKQLMCKLTGDHNFSADAVRLVFGEDLSYHQMLSLDVLKTKSEVAAKLPDLDITF